MDDTAKYLIHARITADGVVERSDVVGAVFGQTEGLLGDELDLRDLQQSSKIGRIDVRIDSENGQSFGEITIASGLDKVETSILAASLESINRVGPCEARVEVTEIEDMRAAQRREVVERAKELLADSFDDSVMNSAEILTEVREANRVERIDEYREYPAGPRVHDSDAVIVVEGRADVLSLLKYGIKNGVAVEGTNVPDEIADLTRERTVTAFLDGDRGGELILRELAQVGEVDYVAFAPEGRSVEDLSRHELMAALREKVPFESVDLDGVGGFDGDGADASGRSDRNGADGADGADARRNGDGSDSDGATRDDSGAERSEQTPERGDPDAVETVAATDGSTQPAPDADAGDSAADAPATTETPESPGTPEPVDSDDAVKSDDADDSVEPVDSTESVGSAESDDPADADGSGDTGEASTLREHAREVVAGGSNRARLLDSEYGVVREVPAADAFEAVSESDGSAVALVLDGQLSQRLLDVAAQRGVAQVVAEAEGEYVKRPTSVRVVTADRMLSA
ncbi:DNA primase [Halobaculum sp. CBA1158]|uniref:DNA primase DnaG n=1 Tax=Halobaculum sp. CBA1158 TaxID=2904243 RepID=UPI001F30F980|nr:DNA primase DnaG [Halobaculum sp. CBA1158]UIP00819.1 DNA primase [Halobaculum sp. CBA1158]